MQTYHPRAIPACEKNNTLGVEASDNPPKYKLLIPETFTPVKINSHPQCESIIPKPQKYRLSIPEPFINV